MEKKKQECENGGLKLCFWNVAGLGRTNKCEDTWSYLEKFDVIGLSETWVEEGTWRKISDKVSKRYE